MDDFERGMSVKRLDELFETLKQGLLPLIARIQSSPHQIDTSRVTTLKYDVEVQTKLNHQIAKELGFDTVFAV